LCGMIFGADPQSREDQGRNRRAGTGLLVAAFGGSRRPVD
jgi:hypothetical protein